MRNLCLGMALLVGVMVTSGCETMRSVPADRAEIRSDRATIAVSLDTSILAEQSDMPDTWAFHSASVGFAQSQALRLFQAGSGKSTGLFETTSDRVRLQDLKVTWQVGDTAYETYKSSGPGPEVDVARGGLVYIGSLGISDIQFDDMGNPESLLACFEDAWLEERDAWAYFYRLFRNDLPEKRISPCWGKKGQVVLSRLRPQYADINAGPRYFRPTQPPSPRPSNPANAGRTP